MDETGVKDMLADLHKHVHDVHSSVHDSLESSLNHPAIKSTVDALDLAHEDVGAMTATAAQAATSGIGGPIKDTSE